MHLLDKDDRDAGVMRFVDSGAGRKHPVFVARHVVDGSHDAVVNEGAGLNVDDNQGRLSFDQGAFGGVRVRQSVTPTHASQVNRRCWLVHP